MLTHRHLLSFIKIENDVHSPIIVRNDKHHSEYPLSLSCLQWRTLTGPFDFHSCNFIIGTYWLLPLMTAHFSGNWFYVQRFLLLEIPPRPRGAGVRLPGHEWGRDSTRKVITIKGQRWPWINLMHCCLYYMICTEKLYAFNLHSFTLVAV